MYLQRTSSPSPRAYQSGSKFSSAIKDESEGLDGGGGHTNGDGSDNPGSAHVAPKRTKRVYSTTDASDPLNAEIDNDIYIDTRVSSKFPLIVLFTSFLLVLDDISRESI